MGHWDIVEAKTRDCYLVLRYYEDGCDVASYQAECRWDGCVHFYRFFNGNDSVDHPDTDYLHICGVADFIRELQQLQQAAREFFKSKQWDEHWREYD